MPKRKIPTKDIKTKLFLWKSIDMFRKLLEVLSAIAWWTPSPEKMIEGRKEASRMYAFMIYWCIWLFIVSFSIFATVVVTFLAYVAGKLFYDFASSDSRSDRARYARARLVDTE